MDENSKTYKVHIGAKVDPIVRDAVEKLAKEDDRPLSNMIERLLRANPEVQAQIDAMESEEVAAQ